MDQESKNIPDLTQPVQFSSQNKPLVNPINSKKSNSRMVLIVATSLLVIIVGVVSGWLLAGKKPTGKSTQDKVSQVTDTKGVVEEAGIGNEKSYGSTTEGVLKRGGIKGEGTHYIDRSLGENKFVYITSSVVDLDSFIDKKVTVWGETISAKYASWLIDVGKIKVVK